MSRCYFCAADFVSGSPCKTMEQRDRCGEWEAYRTLPDGRDRLVQENSLLRSQLDNCNKEIKRLREALLTTVAPPPSQLVEVNIKRMETLADSALDRPYEKECQEQMRLAASLLRQAYSISSKEL